MIPASPSPRQCATIVSHRALFTAFFKIGVLGFGGVTGWVRQIVVEERGFLDDREFAELLGVAHVLPGANTVNLATMLGDRYNGASGAAAALLGLLIAPILILIAVVSLYDRFAALPDVQGALGGAAAATAGLMIGNAYKMVRAIRRDAAAILIAGAAFLAAGVLHLPLVATLATLIPASILAVAVVERRR
ncbi:chromate transporter [Methylocapsa aurea]|uniref:chromate transporter n=1 Tax=Methylocapsa aurea TaxID=663610 RepID=UPI000563CC3C|nr:chromate transporter [Methylocapsa aurea]